MDTEGLLTVRQNIERASGLLGNQSEPVTLVAVSKGRSNEAVERVAKMGQEEFGENRQQGLAERIPSSELSDVEWHFIGPLQRRKVPFVAEHSVLLHSMDRMSLAGAWAKSSATPVLVQFNLADEQQKSGFRPDDASKVMEQLLDLGIEVRGVMAIPPYVDDATLSIPHFVKLRTIFDDYRGQYANMEYCSMGMSNDYVTAIAEGSTMVRVGRAIFEQADI